jgi:hypothetical protein
LGLVADTEKGISEYREREKSRMRRVEKRRIQRWPLWLDETIDVSESEAVFLWQEKKIVVTV